MRKVLYLVCQNLRRKRFRTAVMVCGIALACATLFLAIVLSKGVQNTLHAAAQRLGADIVAVPIDSIAEAESALISGNPTAFYMPSSIEAEIMKVAGIEKTSPQVFLRSLDAPCCVAQVALVGYDPVRDLTISPWVLQKTGKPLQNNQIIVGAKVISAVVGTPSRAIGQRLIFMGKPFTVATILEPTGLGTDFSVFVTMDTAYRLTEDSPLYPVPVKRDQISTVLIRLKDGYTAQEVAKAIQEQVSGVKAITANELTRSVGGQLGSLVDILYFAGCVFCVLAIVLAGTFFMLSVRQRLRELGLFRAMGATNRFISQLIILEAVCIAGLGGVLGVLIGIVVAFAGRDIITDMVGNVYMWPETEYFGLVAILCVGIALLTGIIGGIYPAKQLSGMDPYDAIRKGE